MAEQALVADLRINLTKFDADMRKAMAAADKTSAAISQSMNKVGNSVKPLDAEFNKLNQSIRRLEESSNRAAQASERQTQMMTRFKGVLGSLGLLVTAQQMLQFASSTIKAAEAMTGVEQQLTKLTGSSKLAANEMAFVRAETDRLALSTIEGAKGYARIANAAKGTIVEGEGIRRVFTAINEMARASRLSTEQYNNILNQLTQTMAKGKFQGEELTTIAEAGVPAYNLLAKAMGVTREQLSKMIQAGKVSSDNILLLADQISKEYNDLAEQAANSIPAKFTRGLERIKLEFVDLAQGILNSSELIKKIKFDSNMADIFPDRSVISEKVDQIVRELAALAELVSVLFKATTNLISQSFTNMFNDIQKTVAGVMTWLNNTLAAIPGYTAFKGVITKIINDIANLANAAEAEAAKVGEQGLLATILGIDEKDPTRKIEEIVRTLKEKLTGVKLLDIPEGEPIWLDPIVVESEADKAGAIYQGKIDQLRLNATSQALMINSGKEAQEAEDAAQAIRRMRRGLEEDAAKEQEKIHADFLRILDRTNQERIAQDRAPEEELNKTIADMKENIRESMATTISDAIKGDLDNIKDVADLIKGIFADVFANIASEIIAKQVIDPLLDNFKGVIAQIKGIVTGQGGAPGGGAPGGGGLMGTIGGVVGGVGAGVGVGMAASQLAGGGRQGGAIGGAVGGAVAGASIGTLVVPGIGTAIGAAVGAIVGGIAGGLMSKSEDVKELVMQTTAGWPSAQETDSFARSPFGLITLFDSSKASDEVATAATMAISEIDSAMAKYMNESQRAMVEKYFQSAVPEGQQVRSKETDDAIAKAVQQRLYQAILVLQGEDVARNVVGELYTADKGNIQAIQQRAMEALDILATIADFKAGDLSQTAQQIKAINDQFQQLKDRATVLGLPTEDITAEQQKQLTKITKDFNEGIADAILGITDPVKQEFAELERMQAERMQNAIDAGADLAAVEQLNQLEREELEKRHQEQLTSIVEHSQKDREAAAANIFQAIYSIEDPFKAAMLSIQQQVAAFQAQVDEGLIPQSLVDRFEGAATGEALAQEQERRDAEIQAVEDFNQEISDALLGMKDSYALEMLEMDRMHEERYRKAIEMGADLNAVAELNHAERLQAEQEHQDELNRLIAEKQREGEAAINNIFMLIWQIEDPFRAVLLGIQMQVAQLQAQVDAGLIPQSLVDRYETDALAQAQQQEQERRQQEAQSIIDFNNQISMSILGMTDTYLQESMELELMQQDRIRRAQELGADMAAVDYLNQLEREALEQQHQDTLTQIQQDAQQAQQDATNNIMQAILDIEDPFMAAMFRMQQQVAAFQAQADAGLISQSLVDRYAAAAQNQVMQQEQDRRNREAAQRQAEAQRAAQQRQREAEQRRREAQQRAEQARREAEQRKREAQQRAEQRKREAEQRKREAEQRKREQEQEAERRRQAALQFQSALLGFTDPAKAAMQQLNEQVKEFRQHAKEGIIPKSAVEMFRRLSLATLEVDQALQAIGGGGGSPIEQVGAAFETFIRAGSPQSQAVKQMSALQDQFSGLVEAAKILGLSTEQLEWSYQQQAKTIREDAIDAINKEMDAKKDQLEQVDEFFAKMRLSDVLPEKMRFDEARSQFGEAVKGGNIQEAIAASEQYLGIAQERFGSTQQYFSARSEVERMLTNLREQQARSIEAEREKRITQENRELEQVHIARTSVDFLRRISTDNSATSRGINQLISIARSQTNEQVQTRELLLRLVAKNRA